MAKPRLVTPDDYQALSAMLSAFPWEGMTAMPWRDRIRHWWDDNPVFDDGWERGWVLEDAGKLVGFLGSVPRRVSFEGQVACSANATTWWVAPEHRKSSLALLARFNAQKACGHFNTTGSETTNKLMEAFGYGPYPGDSWKRESLVIVDPARVAAALVRQRLQGRWAAGAKAVAAALAGPAPLGRLVQRLRLRSAAGPYRWASLDRADERFDALAAVLARRYRFTAHRDRAALDWYLRGEAPDRKLLVVALRGEALAGHAVFLQRESGSLAELPVLDCIDLARDSDDPHLVGALVRGVAALAEERRIPLVVLRHFDDFLAGCYRACGLYQRPSPPRRDFAKLPPVSDQGGYYLTQFHGDFFI